MLRSACVLLALLGLPLRPALADDALASAGTVYKLGVKLNNGHAAIGSATLVAPGKLITSCHTTRDAVEIFVLHRGGPAGGETGAERYAPRCLRADCA